MLELTEKLLNKLRTLDNTKYNINFNKDNIVIIVDDFDIRFKYSFNYSENSVLICCGKYVTTHITNHAKEINELFKEFKDEYRTKDKEKFMNYLNL